MALWRAIASVEVRLEALVAEVGAKRERTEELRDEAIQCVCRAEAAMRVSRR